MFLLSPLKHIVPSTHGPERKVNCLHRTSELNTQKPAKPQGVTAQYSTVKILMANKMNWETFTCAHAICMW